jgi:low temperature requirement protein LtrA
MRGEWIIVAAPRAHGEQPSERVVGPLELFYDLLVAVLVAQAAHHLAGCLTGRGLGEFVAVSGLVWIAWLYFDFAGHRRPRPARASTVQWMLTHLRLTVAVAAMGAAIVVLVGHAHDSRTPAAMEDCQWG